MLALQGDVREHLAALDRAGAEPVTVRDRSELESVDGLIFPGGESTTIGRLLRVLGLEGSLRERLAAGMPTMSTCAGLILLSTRVLDGSADQMTLGLFDITTRRNAYGRQVDSFEADVAVEPLGVAPFRAVFIRAPGIESVGERAHVIATHDGKPVAVTQGHHLGLGFHPEMTDDPRLHELFVRSVEAALVSSVA